MFFLKDKYDKQILLTKRKVLVYKLTEGHDKALFMVSFIVLLIQYKDRHQELTTHSKRHVNVSDFQITTDVTR